MQFDALNPKVVLGVAAHPDDLDFNAGGALAAFARQGADVYFMILTDGCRGSADRAITPRKLTDVRQKEQRAACDAMGAREVAFCAYPDGCLENCTDVRRDIVRAIRQLKPDVVVTWDPTMVYCVERQMINHADHRAAGQATLDAVYPLARDHLSFPELLEKGFEPHKVRTVLLMNFNDYNYGVDITGTFDDKMRAMAAHRSQIADLAAVTTRFTQYAETAGAECNVQYAELFVRLDIET